jgi:transcriptional regulator with PAS, ATPase and Fis domain
MKKDMVELKKIVLQAYDDPGNADQLIKEHPGLFENLDSAPQKESVVLNLNSNTANTPEESVEEVQDISHETEDESLSIEKKEKELIVRALQKNNNKRKYAARDLGISERTLYRKIKQYDLEE